LFHTQEHDKITTESMT